MANPEQTKGIRFQTAVILFLIVVVSGPLLLAADLFYKAIQAERQRLEKTLFQDLERALSHKKQDFIQSQSRPFSQFPRLASDAALVQADPIRFREIVASISDMPAVKAVSLISWDGAIILASGTDGIETFQSQLRTSHPPVIQNSTGLGYPTSIATGSPYLCISYDFMQHSLECTREWTHRMNSDHEFRMFVLAPTSGNASFTVKPLKVASERLASVPPPFDFPAEVDPNDPAVRTLIIATGSSQVACLLDHFSPGWIILLTGDTTGIDSTYRHFLLVSWFKVGVSLVFMLICGAFFAARLGYPIRVLDEACDRIESGNYVVDPAPTSFFELNRLGETFRRMGQRIGSRIEAADRELAERHRKLQALFESVTDGIYLLDSRFRVVLANPTACRRFNATELPPEGLALDDTRAANLSPLATQSGGLVSTFRDVIDSAWYRLTATPLIDAGGSCFGYVVVERDVTLEREIDRMKSEFVSNVSHELRTPLTSIQAYAEMLVDAEAVDPAQTREYLDIILSETERLTRLINDVLDLSRIESGRQVVKKSRVNPAELARHTVKIMEKWAARKKLTLQTFIEESEDTVQADRDLLEQALLNLLSNAIKYTPEGGTLTVFTKIRDGNVTLGVRDTGIGLSLVERERLFTKFFRADHDVVRQAGGTGLGLVLVGEIARLHGGTVEVESTPGKGSTFSLQIPLS